VGETRDETAREAAQLALGHAEQIAGRIGPRPVGSEGDRETARYVQSRLSASGLKPSVQAFRAPRDEWTPFIIAGLSMLLGVVFWMILKGSLFGAYLGALGLGFGLWEVYSKLNFGWSPLRLFVREYDTENVFACVQPTEEVGRNAVVFAHLDSQRTPFLFRSRARLRFLMLGLYVIVALGIVTLLAFVVSWFAEFTLPQWVGVPLLVAVVVMMVVLVQAQLSPYSVGANDNAAAVGVNLELARHFQAHPLKHTRLWFVFTSAEETGCQGATAFLMSEGDELLQAYAVALEGSGVSAPAYTSREGTLGRYTSNPELLRLLDRLQKSHPELGLRQASIRGGYTEAGAAIKRGYRSVALVGLDESGNLPYWHTIEDTPDKLRPEALAATWQTAVGLLEGLDGLPVSVKLSAITPLSQRS